MPLLRPHGELERTSSAYLRVLMLLQSRAGPDWAGADWGEHVAAKFAAPRILKSLRMLVAAADGTTWEEADSLDPRNVKFPHSIICGKVIASNNDPHDRRDLAFERAAVDDLVRQIESTPIGPPWGSKDALKAWHTSLGSPAKEATATAMMRQFGTSRDCGRVAYDEHLANGQFNKGGRPKKPRG